MTNPRNTTATEPTDQQSTVSDIGRCPYSDSVNAPDDLTTTPPLPRFADVGWILDTDSAQLIWPEPRRVKTQKPERVHAKSLARCPAVLDSDSRLFEITCPFDLELGFRRDQNGKPVLVNLLGDQSPVRASKLGQLVSITSETEWAHPDRPVIQIITPYLLVTDEPIYVNQLPPFNHWRAKPLPGVMVSGRFPADIWPRHLMWAFEWYDIKQPISLRRGEPWWYLRFDHFDPSRAIRMIPAQMTADLQEYLKGIKGVTNYVNHTYQLFKIARERRPAVLLSPKALPIPQPESAAMQQTILAEQQLIQVQSRSETIDSTDQ